MGGLCLLGIVALLAAPSTVLATCAANLVWITSTGPTPSTMTVVDTAPIYFLKDSTDAASRVAFDDGSCFVDLPAGWPADEAGPDKWCMPAEPGVYGFHVEGYGAGAGTITVVAPLMIDDQASPVTFGSKITLTGQSRVSSCGPPGVSVPGPDGI